MKKWRFVAPVAALAAVAVVAVSLVGSGAAAPTAGYKAGLVSDVGRFNDKGFNQNQLTGLKFAKAHIPGLQTAAIESHSAGDYLPNFASLARKGYRIFPVWNVNPATGACDCGGRRCAQDPRRRGKHPVHAK